MSYGVKVYYPLGEMNHELASESQNTMLGKALALLAVAVIRIFTVG